MSFDKKCTDILTLVDSVEKHIHSINSLITPVINVSSSQSDNSPVSYSARHQRPARENRGLLELATSPILPFPIRRATSVPLGKGTKFALHHGKMSTTKRRARQKILHISTFQFTFKCGYNDFISKYTDINSLHVTQIALLHNDTFCRT